MKNDRTEQYGKKEVETAICVGLRNVIHVLTLIENTPGGSQDNNAWINELEPANQMESDVEVQEVRLKRNRNAPNRYDDQYDNDRVKALRQQTKILETTYRKAQIEIKDNIV